MFDGLFRHALGAVYEALGDEVPEELATPISPMPISPMPVAEGGRAATGYVTPRLTASPYPGEGWAAAAMFRPASASTGAMQRAEGQIEQLFVGHDARALYLRLDLREPLADFDTALYLCGTLCAPAQPASAQPLRQPGADSGEPGVGLGDCAAA